MHHSSFNCDDFGSHLTKTHQYQQIRILHKTNNKIHFFCICTQYMVGAPFALITASIRRGMEVISLWNCWVGMEAQVSLTVAFSSSAFIWSLVSYFPLDNIDSLWGSVLVSLLASQAHQHHGHLTNFWCFWQCGQLPNPAGKWNQHL